MAASAATVTSASATVSTAEVRAVLRLTSVTKASGSLRWGIRLVLSNTGMVPGGGVWAAL